jgi:DNA (cytosine-5)-methyltransferase 1
LDGITLSSHRRKTVKASGNAVVPQVALQIFRAIEGCEKTKIV